MLEFLVLFVFGLILLVKGSDYFVEAVAKIASIFGVSPFVIGLTIVAIGTSLPEMASSVVAATSGSPDLAMGTVVGSNVANIALILGLSALFSAGLKVKKNVLEKDVFIMFMVSILLFYFALDGLISFEEGLTMLALFAAYILFLLGFMKKFVGLFNYEKYMTTFFGTEKFSIFNFKTYVSIMKTGIDPKTYHAIVASGVKGFSERFGANIKKGEKADIKEQFRKSFFGSMFRYILIILISAVAVIFGARMLIDGAIGIASAFSVPDSVVGLLMVAVGTSLPELGVSISSARKGFHDILLGNIVGSNISNILLVLGSASVATPIAFSIIGITIPLFFMLAVTLVLMLFVFQGLPIGRFAGLIFLFIYVLFVLRTTGFLI